MGTILLIAGGLVGAGSAFKKSFTSCWMFLINFACALYISIFVAPLTVPLLEIPGLTEGYKNAIAIGCIFLVADLILRKITEQIIPNPEKESNLPKFVRIFSIAAGFLSGIMVVGILLYCFMQTPFVDNFSQKKELRSTARNTLMGVVHVVNGFSFQSLSPEAENDLRMIHLLPKKKKPAPANADQQKNDQSKSEPAGENVKKDSAEASAKTAGKPDGIKKAD